MKEEGIKVAIDENSMIYQLVESMAEGDRSKGEFNPDRLIHWVVPELLDEAIDLYKKIYKQEKN